MAVSTALAAMALGDEKGQEEEEEKCSVCLNVIDNTDADDPPGPPLMCGHLFACGYWVERFTSKCIEHTCPYCRAPLQEVQSIKCRCF